MSAIGEVDSMAVQEPPQASPSPLPTLLPTDNYDNTTLPRLSDASNDTLLTSQSNPLTTTITSNNVLAAVGPSASITRAGSLPCSLSPETERGQTPSPLPDQDTFSPNSHSPPIATITQSDISTQREHESTTSTLTGIRASKGRTSTSAPHSLSRNERAQTTTVSPSSSRASSHTRQGITTATSSSSNSGARQLSSAVAAVYKRALVAANKHSSNNATSSTLRRSIHTAANTSTSKSDTAASRSPQRTRTNTMKTTTAAAASATCLSAQEETKEVSRSTCSTSPSTHHALSHTLAGNAEDERIVEEEQASTSASLRSKMDEPRMTHTTSHVSGHVTTQTDKFSTRNTSKSTPPLGASGSLATSTPDSARTSHSLTSVTTNHSGSVASSRNSVVWYSLLLRFKGLLDRQEAVLERVSRLNTVRVRSDGTLEPGSSEALANITALSNATPQTVSFSTSASSPSLSLLVPQKSNEAQSSSPNHMTHISLHDAGYLLAAHARPIASPATQHVLAQRVLSEAETRAATRLLHAHHSRKRNTHDDSSNNSPQVEAEPITSSNITVNAVDEEGVEVTRGVYDMKRESSVVVVRPVLDEKCTCTATTTTTSALHDVRHTGEDTDGSAEAIYEQSPILLVRHTTSPAPLMATNNDLPHTPRVECHTEEEQNDPNERISLTRMDMSARKPPALQPVFDCADTALDTESSSATLPLEGTVQQRSQYKASISSAMCGRDRAVPNSTIDFTTTTSSGTNNTRETQETMRGLALHHSSSNVYNQLMTGTVNSGAPNKTSEAHHESEDEMMNLTGDPGLASRTNSMLHFTLQPCASYASNTTTTLYGGVNGGSFASATISPLSQPMSSRNEYLNVSLNNYNANSAMTGVNTSAAGTPAMLRGFSSVYYYATSPSSAAATNPSMTPRQLISPAANATSTLTNASVSSASNTLTTTNTTTSASNNNATPAKASFLARVALSPAPITTATDNAQPCNETSGTTPSTTAQAALSNSETRPPHVLASTSNRVNVTEIVDAASTSSASPSASSVEENTRPTKEEDMQADPAHTTTTATTDVFTRPKSWPAPPIPTMRRPPIVPHGTSATALASPKHTATTHIATNDEKLFEEAHMHSATSDQEGVRYASTTADDVSSLPALGQSHEKDMPGMASNTTANVMTSLIPSEEAKFPAVDAAELRRSDSWRAFELRHGQEHLPPAWLAPSVHVKSSDKGTRNTSRDAEQEEEEKEIQRVRAVRAAPATLLTETHSFHSDSEIYSSSYSTRSNSSNSSSEDAEEGSEVQRRRRHNAFSAEVHTHTSYAGTSVAAVSASLAAALLSGFSVHSHRYAPRRNATGQRRNVNTSTSTGHVSEATRMEGQNNDSNTLTAHDTASTALSSSQQGDGVINPLTALEPQTNPSEPNATRDEGNTVAHSHDSANDEEEAGLYDLNNSLRELSRVEAQNIIALSARPLRRPRRARHVPERRQLRDWPTTTAALTPRSLNKSSNREADIESEGGTNNATVEEENTALVAVPARVNSRDDVPRLTDSPLPPTRTDRAHTIDEETPLQRVENDEARQRAVPTSTTTSSSSTSPSMSRTPSVLSMSGSRKAHNKDDRLHTALHESHSTPRTSLVQTTASLSGADEVCQVMRHAIKGQRTLTVGGKHGDETNILMSSTQSRADYHDKYERDEEEGELRQSREYASVEVMRRDTNSYTETELQDTVCSVNDRMTIGRVLVSSSISSSGTRDVQEDTVRVTSVAPTLVTSQANTEEKNNKDEAITSHTLSAQVNDERDINEADVPSPLPPAPLSTPNTHNTTTAREGRNSSSPSHASSPSSSRDRISNSNNSSDNTPHRSHAQRTRTPRFRFLHTPRGTSRPNALGHPARSKAIASVVAAAVAASTNSPLPTSMHNNNNKNTRTKEATTTSSHERRVNKTTQPHLTLVDFMNDNSNENDTSEDVVGLSAVLARDLSAMEKTLHTRPEGHFAQPVHPLASQFQRPLRLPRRRRWEKRSGSMTPTNTAVLQQHYPHRRRRGERILRQDASHAASSWTSIPRERHAVHVRTATYTSVNTNSSTSKEAETHVPPTASNTITHVPTHTAPVTTTTTTTTTNVSNVTHAQAHTAASWYKRRGKYGVGATERPTEAAEEVKAPTIALGVSSGKAHLTNTVKASQPLHPHCPGHRVRHTDHMHSTHTKEAEQVIPAQHLESVRTQPRGTVNAEMHATGARQANPTDLSTQEESRTSVSELPSVVRELFITPPSAEQAPHVDNTGVKHSTPQRTRLTRDGSDDTVKATPTNTSRKNHTELSEKREGSHNTTTTTISKNNADEAQVRDISTTAEEEQSMTLRSESRPSSVLPVVNADISLTSLSTAAIAPTTLPTRSACNDPGNESPTDNTTMHNEEEEANKAAVDEKESVARSESQRDKRGSQGSDTTTTTRRSFQDTTITITSSAGNEKQQLQNCTRRRYLQEGNTSRMRTARTAQCSTHLEAPNKDTTTNSIASVVSLAPLSHNTSSASSMSYVGGVGNNITANTTIGVHQRESGEGKHYVVPSQPHLASSNAVCDTVTLHRPGNTSATTTGNSNSVTLIHPTTHRVRGDNATAAPLTRNAASPLRSVSASARDSLTSAAMPASEMRNETTRQANARAQMTASPTWGRIFTTTTTTGGTMIKSALFSNTLLSQYNSSNSTSVTARASTVLPQRNASPIRFPSALGTRRDGQGSPPHRRRVALVPSTTTTNTTTNATKNESVGSVGHVLNEAGQVPRQHVEMPAAAAGGVVAGATSKSVRPACV